VLTIGYLIVEADDVKVTDAKGRTLPAQIVGYDHASGFGLVRTAVPLDAQPIALGDSGRTAERDPVMIASAGDERRGVRLYRVEAAVHRQLGVPARLGALHEPAAANWSGAALIDREGSSSGSAR
jgi:hypothetical protein